MRAVVPCVRDGWSHIDSVELGFAAVPGPQTGH